MRLPGSDVEDTLSFDLDTTYVSFSKEEKETLNDCLEYFKISLKMNSPNSDKINVIQRIQDRL